MPTTPPTITAAPQAPQRGVKATFNQLMDAFLTWLVAAVTQFAAVANNVFNNATEAFNSASAAAQSATNAATSEGNALASANAAAVTTGATLWVSGQTVAQDVAKISPADRRTYRKRTASSSTTIDPSIDPTNYVLLSADATALMPLGSATISSAVANIDYLNIFSDAYVKYVVEIVGLKISGNGNLTIRFASGGVIDTSSVYFLGVNQSDRMELYGLHSATDFSATFELRSMRSNASSKQLSYVGGIGESPPGSGHARWTNTAVGSGFRLFLTNGATFTAGTVRVYGVRA